MSLCSTNCAWAEASPWAVGGSSVCVMVIVLYGWQWRHFLWSSPSTALGRLRSEMYAHLGSAFGVHCAAAHGAVCGGCWLSHLHGGGVRVTMAEACLVTGQTSRLHLVEHYEAHSYLDKADTLMRHVPIENLYRVFSCKGGRRVVILVVPWIS